MKLDLVKYPDPILRANCFEDVTPDFNFMEEIKWPMHRVMEKYGGVGIAAPQVGVVQPCFWCNGFYYINPVILQRSTSTSIEYESCLSLGRKSCRVERYNNLIIVNYKSGIFEEEKLSGYEARVFQHEYDHLIGKLIIDYEDVP